jgi:hypothetical protein
LRAYIEPKALFFDGINHAAESRAALEQLDREAFLLQSIRAGQPGDSAADHQDVGGSRHDGRRVRSLQRLREQRFFRQTLLLQVWIEKQGHVADEDAPQ